MKRLLGGCVVLLLILAPACGGGSSTATSPSPTLSPAQASPAPTITRFSLNGRVISSFSSFPIPDATVSIVDGPDAGTSATTDASGNYTFTGLQPSRFKVNVSADNYFSSSAPVTLTSNQTQTFFLIPTGPSIVLTGQVTDAATSAPIAGATVRINGRYSTITDGSGRYSVTGFLDLPADNATYIVANDYDGDTRYIRGTSQNVRLYRIERMTAGDSKAVVVAPDDTLCNNNLQEPSFGSKYVCRSVHVVAPSDGVMTVEALSTQGGARPPLEVETANVSPCCSERMGNPTSIQV